LSSNAARAKGANSSPRMVWAFGLDRVHAKVRERRQHGRRVMDFMEFPEERDAMREIVIEPIAKLIGQKQQDRDRGAIDKGRQGRRRPRLEAAVSACATEWLTTSYDSSAQPNTRPNRKILK
jgi:hypothetical protein